MHFDASGRQRGGLRVAPVVLDGAVRDSLELDDMQFPVFSVGTNPNGPTKEVGGRIGHPISVGGVTVNPGDYICGDADGLVVVEREKIEEASQMTDKSAAQRDRDPSPYIRDWRSHLRIYRSAWFSPLR